jgi:hypothetical protein
LAPLYSDRQPPRMRWPSADCAAGVFNTSRMRRRVEWVAGARLGSALTAEGKATPARWSFICRLSIGESVVRSLSRSCRMALQKLCRTCARAVLGPRQVGRERWRV